MATRGREQRFFLAGAARGGPGGCTAQGEVMNEPCHGEGAGHEALPCSWRAGGSPFAPD